MKHWKYWETWNTGVGGREDSRNRTSGGGRGPARPRDGPRKRRAGRLQRPPVQVPFRYRTLD